MRCWKSGKLLVLKKKKKHHTYFAFLGLCCSEQGRGAERRLPAESLPASPGCRGRQPPVSGVPISPGAAVPGAPRYPRGDGTGGGGRSGGEPRVSPSGELPGEPLRGGERDPAAVGPHLAAAAPYLAAPRPRRQPPSSRCYSYGQPPRPRSRESRHLPATAPGRAAGGRLLSRERRGAAGSGRLPSGRGGGRGSPQRVPFCHVRSCHVQGSLTLAAGPSAELAASSCPGTNAFFLVEGK